MLYLKNLTKLKNGEGYPFIELVNNLENIEFTKPVTIFAGENGSGKSTLLKIIATEMDCVFNDQANKISNLQSGFFRISKIKPKSSLHFSAESFIRYINNFDRVYSETLKEIEQIKNSDEISEDAKGYALMPYYRTLYEMQNQYEGVLSEQSHGEGFLDFFFSRLKDGGLYLIDEPEAALSYCNQYVLAYKIYTFAKEKNCQFIICTHSPIISAIPDAQIYEISGNEIIESSYNELENFRFLNRFLKDKENMFK